MFCSECGHPASGKFCSNCGAALQTATPPPPPPPTPSIPPPPPPRSVNWADEVDYEALLRVPEVRDILAHQIPAAAAMSADGFATAFEKVTSNPLPLAPMMHLTHDLYTHMGIKTGKERTAHFARPVGRTIVSLLCSLARQGQKIRTVQQASDGLVVIAAIPSDFFSMEGDLIVNILREPAGTQVTASTRITGQLYDWGKSSRCLDHLFADLAAGI